MVKARKIVLARHFQGEPRLEDFRVEEEDLPPVKEGQILAEAVYFSVDPFQKVLGLAFKDAHKVGQTFMGAQVARIVESRAPGFPVGRNIVAYWGWRDRTVADVGPHVPPPTFMSPPMLVPDLGDLPLSLSLGVLGMPGISGYFPLVDVLQPKSGEVVVVSGAAGAVGSIVGQIALIKGCTVIGFAGSEAKVKWLKEELGFHHAFNYKTTDVSTALKQAAPDGVDVYFDNVAGDISTAVIRNMRYRGRTAIIGSISHYNETEIKGVLDLPFNFLANQLRIEACSYGRWHDRWDEGINQLMQWVREGKLKYKETVTEGFQNTPKAFIVCCEERTSGKLLSNYEQCRCRRR